MSRRLVFVELNEVPWRVLDDWAVSRPDSAIAGLLRESRQYTTIAADEGHLSPWITWPTVHRGVPNTVHGISDFGQDLTEIDRTAPPYWSVAQRAGRRVGVFAPLHTHPLPDDVERYAFWLPDPFAPDPSAHPSRLAAFQAFNLAMARASARNVSTDIDWRNALRFLLKAPASGLRPRTVATVLRQLVDERRRPWTRIRRRSLQSTLGFDLFLAELERSEPDLAVVFTNHVASAMHRYWAARYADDFDTDEYSFELDWQRRFAAEIDVAMAHADEFLGRVRAFVDERPDYVLVVASSMGQASAQSTPVGRLLLLRDLDRFVDALGAPPPERRPAMDPIVSLRVPPALRETFLAAVARVTVGGTPIQARSDEQGFVSLEFGQADSAIGEVQLDGRAVAPEELGLEIVIVEDEAGSSGYHVPEGSLLVFDPLAVREWSATERPEIPTTHLAPAVLRLLGVDPLEHHVDPDLDLEGVIGTAAPSR